MLEVKIETGRGYRRRPCLVCGHAMDKAAVTASVYEDGEQTHLVVCPTCLSCSPEQRATAIRQQVETLRTEALELERLADNLPALPSYDEWKTADSDWESQYVTVPVRPF